MTACAASAIGCSAFSSIMAWPRQIGRLMLRSRPRFARARRTTCCSCRNRQRRLLLIHPLQRGRFALFDLAAGAARAVVPEKLARQALIGDGGVRVGCLPTARTNVGKPVFGAAQAEIGRLLSRLAGPGLLDQLLSLLVGALLLRPRGSRLWWTQVEIGWDCQRCSRFDGKLVGQCLLEADRLLEIATPRSQRCAGQAKNAQSSQTAARAANPVMTEHGRTPPCPVIPVFNAPRAAEASHRPTSPRRR